MSLVGKSINHLGNNTALNAGRSTRNTLSALKKITPLWSITQHKHRSATSVFIPSTIWKKLTPFKDLSVIQGVSNKFKKLWDEFDEAEYNSKNFNCQNHRVHRLSSQKEGRVNTVLWRCQSSLQDFCFSLQDLPQSVPRRLEKECWPSTFFWSYFVGGSNQSSGLYICPSSSNPYNSQDHPQERNERPQVLREEPNLWYCVCSYQDKNRPICIEQACVSTICKKAMCPQAIHERPSILLRSYYLW